MPMPLTIRVTARDKEEGMRTERQVVFISIVVPPKVPKSDRETLVLEGKSYLSKNVVPE